MIKFDSEAIHHSTVKVKFQECIKKIDVCNSSESNDIKERPKSLAVSETVRNYINQTMYGSMPLSDVKKSNKAKPTSVSLKDQRKQRSLQLCLQVSAQKKKSSKTY